MAEEPDPAVISFLKKIQDWISEDYNDELAAACIKFYTDEEFDAEGIASDINDCDYPDGDFCALIDELADNDKWSHFLSTDKRKIKFAKALKDAINDAPRGTILPFVQCPDLKDITWVLQKGDPRRAGNTISKQCPGLFEEKEEDSFKYVLAYGTKNS